MAYNQHNIVNQLYIHTYIYIYTYKYIYTYLCTIYIFFLLWYHQLHRDINILKMLSFTTCDAHWYFLIYPILSLFIFTDYSVQNWCYLWPAVRKCFREQQGPKVKRTWRHTPAPLRAWLEREPRTSGRRVILSPEHSSSTTRRVLHQKKKREKGERILVHPFNR